MMKNKLVFIFIVVCGPLLARSEWEQAKNQGNEIALPLSRHFVQEKANLIADLIKEKNLQICVEIGLYRGSTFLPMAEALAFKKSGMAYGIDAWDTQLAPQGLSRKHDPLYAVIEKEDFEKFYQQFLRMIKDRKLDKYCTILRMFSSHANTHFSDNSIDFIHFDGSYLESIIVSDFELFYPKIKDGGYILISEPNFAAKRKMTIFLMERAEVLCPFAPTASFFLFKKSQALERKTKKLLKDEVT